MKNRFLTKSILALDVTLKNYGKYMKFSLNVYINLFYTRKKFQNILTCFELFTDILSFQLF